MIHSTLGSQLQMERVIGLSQVFIIGIDLVFCKQASACSLTKLARFNKAESGNMCKVDHQALSCVKVLSEAHL